MSATTASNNSGSLSSNHPRTPTPTRSSSSLESLNKLKRFLSTLYHFGSDISSEVGERVRALILALVNNALSVEEFHGKVQAATNFPLRPFALPFLKSTLPHLQKDLSQLAHQSKQSTSQFLAQNEALILLPRDVLDRSNSPLTSNLKDQINENGKRKLSNDKHELDQRSYARKRSSANHHHHRSFAPSSTNNNPIISTSIRRDIRDKERGFTAYLREYVSDLKDSGGKNTEDDWKNAENMLNYILESVTKLKRVLFMLQQKDNHLRRLIETTDLEWRRRHTDLLTQTEVRIVEGRRKAGELTFKLFEKHFDDRPFRILLSQWLSEEAVLEIKRQSTIAVQKAVSQTEEKSNEILLREREQYERLNQELKTQTFEEAYAVFNRQEDGPEQCWNCGRKAIETCSGCNIARYCGQYCQHRDWELHQKLCDSDLKRRLRDNPLLYRSSFSKFSINISPNHQKETLSVNITRRNSDTVATTPYLTVSPPSIFEAIATTKTTSNDDNKSDKEKDEINTLEK